MKKISKILIVFLMITVGGFKSFSQIIVKVRPSRPSATVVVRRPVAPSPRHVWVEEEWVPNGSRYVWHGGYWAAPPRHGAIYVAGHWKDTRRGSIWVPGHWR